MIALSVIDYLLFYYVIFLVFCFIVITTCFFDYLLNVFLQFSFIYILPVNFYPLLLEKDYMCNRN